MNEFIKRRFEEQIEWKMEELIYIYYRLIDFILFMYNRKYFHGDIKPSNLVLDKGQD